MVAVSGITPSGRLTLGNYLGALRRFAAQPGDGFYFVANLHAMTTPHDPRRLAELTRETAMLMLASGVPGSSVFIQSTVPAHAQIGYLMECTVHMGELSRMIQFKEKGRGRPQTRASLFTYPCLMAADILLYGASRVPVGGDQDQHVELARDLAIRFNTTYGETFVVPELDRATTSARVLDLADPTTKMSKSAPDQAQGVIRMLDSPDAIRRKILRAVTDSEAEVRYDPATKAGVSNLLEILAAATAVDPVVLAAGYDSYGALKDDATQAVISLLQPVQERFSDLAAHPGAVDWALRTGRDRANDMASRQLDAAYLVTGLSRHEIMSPTG